MPSSLFKFQIIIRQLYSCLLGSLIFVGCATTVPPQDEPLAPWIHNKVIVTEILSDPPGARIEIGSQYVGEVPLHFHILRVYGLFGWEGFNITANPVYAGHCVQRKFIGFNESTPTKVFFDMRLCPAKASVNVNVQ